MITLARGRQVAQTLVASTFISVFASSSAPAQGLREYLHKKASPVPGTPAPAPPVDPSKLQLETVRIPTNGTDSIAIVNGEFITRQQLADACVAKKGSEILDTLISRLLIEQEMKRKKMEITANEIDAEIDRVAMDVGHVSREVWLRSLDKERGISPATYARDIIYPSLALRKLAEPKVQVTEQDLKDAFEANFGPRLRCRMIMTNDIRKASEIWDEAKKNPAGFEKMAQEKSLDSATRSFGGLLPDPIARHAVPREVSDAAFTQLVDGDPADKNPAHRPKDGDITGPIQVNEGAWVILKREALAVGKSGSLNDPQVKNMLSVQMFDVKLQDAIKTLYNDLMDAAAIENKLTGQFKEGHEKQQPEYQAAFDQSVKRMSVAGETKAGETLPKGTRAVAPDSTSPINSAKQPPAGVPDGAAATAKSVQNVDTAKAVQSRRSTPR